jgi:hypothetical protein
MPPYEDEDMYSDREKYDLDSNLEHLDLQSASVDVSHFFIFPALKCGSPIQWQGISPSRWASNEDDPNFDPRADILEDESPYPEVRSAVANTDDPTMPASTLRAWFIGIVWAVLIPGINQFFFFRYPSVYISSVCARDYLLP